MLPREYSGIFDPRHSNFHFHLVRLLVTFHHCDKIPEKTNLRRGVIYLAHSFRGFSPWPLVSLASVPSGGMVEGHDRGKLLTSRKPGIDRKGQRSDIPFKAVLHWTISSD
jgi:hypothetical protein